MAIGLTYTVRDGMLHVAGQIDEACDLSILLQPRAGPLRLNMQGVRAINSLGLKKFIDAMRTLGDKPVEFHACAQSFVEAVNTIPLTVGGQSKVGRIKSVMAPMTCEDGHKAAVLVTIADLKVKGDTVEVPRTLCAVCRSVMELENGMTADDFFFFLIA